MAQRSTKRHPVTNAEDVIVHELVTLIQTSGVRILKNETKLVLTLTVLNCLNRKLGVDNENELSSTVDDIVPLSPDGDIWLGLECRNVEDELFLLRDFLRRLSIVKITQGSGTVQGSVDVSQLESLTVLELRRVPIHLLVGLQSLRPHLKMITCSHCLQSLEDLFAGCGGDRCSPFAWSELLSANITDNAIDTIDNSMRLLPSLVSLDLSHNRISDTRGLECLTELQYLNLSYNRLQRLPILGSRARLRLKVISVRNNCLETLEGLGSFINLQQADLAYNCLLDHCVLAPFLGLPHVVMIFLEGNPISFHGKHRMLSAEHLHRRSRLANCVIDGKHLTNSECSAIDMHGSSCRIRRHGEIHANISIGTVTDRPGLRSVDNEMAGPSTESSASNCSLDEPKKPKRRTKKPPLIREVSIAEDLNKENRRETNPISLEIGGGGESDSSDVAESAHTVQDEMEQFRRRHGKEWLVVGSKLNVLTPITLDPNDPAATPSSVVDDDEKKHRQSQISDDVIVLDTETVPPTNGSTSQGRAVVMTDAASPDRPNPSPNNDGKRIPWQKQVSLEDESAEEEEDDDDAVLPPFIVQMEKPGMDSSTTVLVVVSDRDLREKDALTGRTMERLDLRSICSLESLCPTTSGRLGIDCECPRIRIGFTYVRKDRRERIYTMEDVESYREFLALLKPLVDAKTLEEVTSGALQCLKCSAQFSKEVAKRVIRMSRKPPNDCLPFPSSMESCKGYLSEASACPNCTSEMVVELHDGSAKFGGPVSKPGPSRTVQRNAWSAAGSLPRSVSATSESSDIVQRSRRSSSCCTVQVEVEVHAHSLPVALRRSGSDITILSNPSQSSIMVMPSSEYAINMDALSETLSDTLIQEPDRNRAALNIESEHRGCSSSDSVSSSACTALETSIYNCNTAQTPDSFLSSLSDKGTLTCSNSTSELQRSPRLVQAVNSVRSTEPYAAENHSWSPPTCVPLRPSPSVVVVHSSDGSRQITWSCRCARVEYSFSDFGHVDHRLQLYLDMEVLAETEELVALLRTNVVSYVTDQEFPGLLVVSRSTVHILKITKEETDQPQDWLRPYDSKPLTTLMHLNIRLGNQAFQLEFGPQATACCFTFLLRDADHCNNFVTYFLDKLRTELRTSEGGPFQCGLDSEETLQTIREHLLPWKPKRKTSGDNEDDGEVPIVLYLMCYWKQSGSGEFESVSLVMTSTDIYFFSEDLHWPVPHLILPPNEVLSRHQLTPIQRRAIQDLTLLEQSDPSGLELTLTFLDENNREECSLYIATETEASLLAIITALKEPWEKLFGFELQVNVAKQVTTVL